MANTWKEQSPETAKIFSDFHLNLAKAVPISEKDFQLHYIAIQTSRFAKRSAVIHTGLAKKAGATRDEVMGAVLSSLLAVGVAGVMECMEAVLDAYDKAD